VFRYSIAVALSALALSACSVTADKAGGRGSVADPRTQAGRLACLRAHHLPVSEVGTTGLQVGAPPAGATIRFTPTPGAAQADQIAGQTQGAEVIGSALLYPNGASDSELGVIENCIAHGVKEVTS
jgi:fermentation-respiration switch protein FrsA (DUF1100 family)